MPSVGISYPWATRFSSRSARWLPHDGVRRARHPNLFDDLWGSRPAVPDSQRDRLTHRPHGDDTFRRRGFLMSRGLTPQALVKTIALTSGLVVCSRLKRKSTSSIHMRCKIVASPLYSRRETISYVFERGWLRACGAVRLFRRLRIGTVDHALEGTDGRRGTAPSLTARAGRARRAVPGTDRPPGNRRRRRGARGWPSR